MPTVSEFLLNKGPNAEKQVVDAPAFSLTKVLAAGAVIITPIATVIVDAVQEHADFKAQHYVALAIGLLGFLALTAVADVLARALVTAAEKKTDAAQKESDTAHMRLATSAARLVPFDKPVGALRALAGPDERVEVLAAASADDPYFLVQTKDGKITWVPAKEVKLGLN
jgi:hypothetical protein